MSGSANAAWTTSLWVRTQSLFDAALDLEPLARDDYLRTQCADAPLIREAVLRLLQAHEKLGDDDAVPGAVIVENALRDWSAMPRLPAGTRVGDFTVVREIGVGGMGVVYLGERDIDGQTQRVALKLAQARNLGTGLVERLCRERGILAGLEHPHIARLIDAGELDDGTPYFAMEYVEGVAMLRFADDQGLDVDARLRLLLQVVEAVQHAHLNLIVHRDIKSANVLITAAGAAKLLDFGIAKPLLHASDLALTGDAQRFFSPMTAAPEQVKGEATGIGTDIYALGVLAYELLCGGPPFDFSGLRPGEIEQRIIDVVPALPSQALDAQLRRDPSAARAVATARDLHSPAALRQRLRDDLDAIVARALRKLARERYPSAEAFGRDLRAVLECRPIEQRSSDRAYRLRKFVRRQRLPLALSAIALSLLLAFVTTSVMQSTRIAKQRDLAQLRQQQAEEQRKRAEQVSQFLIGLFRASDPENARGRDITARELLDRGANKLDKELQEQPQIRADLMATIGDIYLALNDMANAQRFVEQAAMLREGQGANEVQALADSRIQQSTLALASGGHAEALQRADQALLLVDREGDLARDKILPLRAQALQAGGRIDEAIETWRLVRTRQLRAVGAESTLTLASTRGLATALKAKGEPQQALDLLREALSHQKEGDLPADDPELALLLQRRASLALELGDLESAQRDARRAEAIFLHVYGEVHSASANIHTTLALIATDGHELPLAADEFEHAIKITRSVYGERNPRVANAEYNLGLLQHLNMGKPREAEPHLRAAAQIAIEVMPEEHRNRAQFRFAWGRVLRDLGQFDAAKRELSAALRVFEAHPAPRGVDIARTRGELACLMLVLQANPGAQKDLQAANAVLDHYLPKDDSERLRLDACARSRDRH